MGTIDPELNEHIWENLTSLESVFAEKTYKVLSRSKGKRERDIFNDTLEVVIEVDSGLLIKLEAKFKTIDKMTMEEVVEALEISAHESFVDKKKYIDKALEVVNTSQKKDDRYTALLANLATIYYLMAQYDKALSLCKKSLSIRGKILGKEHLDTASSYSALAKLYQAQTNYVQALPLYKKALAIREKSLGIKHLDTASSYNDLALFYQSQANYAQALPLYKKALAIREKSLGVEHLDTASSYNDLALFYQSQADYAEALRLYQKALAIREKSLDVEHPDTATSYNNLAWVYYLQGDNAQALRLSQKALAIREKSLGVEHPDTATSYDNLGWLYYDQADDAQTLSHYQKALAIREKILGAEHLDTATSYDNLSGFYYYQGNSKESFRLDKKVLAIREKVLGEEHPDTATSYYNLAIFYQSKGSGVLALPLYERALVVREKSLGESHPDTVQVHKKINNFKQEQNKLFFLNSENSNLNFKIDSIIIECFKQYKYFSIAFSPRINIIIGKNAIGKTTLLQAIILVLLKENSPDEEKNYTKYIKKNKKKAKLTLSHNNNKKTVRILKDKREIKNNHFIPFVLSYGSNFFTKYDISADKIVDDMLNETVNKDFSQSIFLDYIDEFWNPLTILRELARSKHEKSTEKKALLFNTINRFLGLENYKLEEKNEKFFFLKEGDDTPLFLEDLSEGYRSNVLLITDMLVKIVGVGWTPATIEGIILIDEFDKHLHPTWQSQLVAKLADTFPNIQFIMTTHNPMSILDREPDEITIIKEVDGEIVAERGKGTKTIDASTVLLEYFGVKSTISESMPEEKNQFEDLIP